MDQTKLQRHTSDDSLMKFKILGESSLDFLKTKKWKKLDGYKIVFDEKIGEEVFKIKKFQFKIIKNRDK